MAGYTDRRTRGRRRTVWREASRSEPGHLRCEARARPMKLVDEWMKDIPVYPEDVPAEPVDFVISHAECVRHEEHEHAWALLVVLASRLEALHAVHGRG